MILAYNNYKIERLALAATESFGVGVYDSITSFSESPSCYFEQDSCNWMPGKGWRLTNHSGERPLKNDWKGTNGMFAHIIYRAH